MKNVLLHESTKTMIKIPNNVQDLRPYKPGKANNDVLNVEDGQHLAVLCSNENNFGPSPKAKEAIVKAMDDLYLYPDPTGIDLRTALAERLGVQVENILLGNGSDGILYTLFNAYFDEGQSILTSKGTFVSLNAMAQMNRIPLVSVPMKEGYQFDLNQIFDSIQYHTKVIYLCNPNNPTGTVIPEEDLTEFIKKVPSNILIVIDEAYCEFAESMDTNYANTLRWKFDNVVTLRT
ncbi:MAG: aminotransferase class I/II-fold pyridoxal phosphate-dependent enzyme, partial [Bacteroidota bacterium]